MGDVNSEFSKVLKQYEGLIVKVIKSLHIYRDYDMYFQEGATALWQAWEKYSEDKGSFTSYAFLTIRGKLLNLLKRESKYRDHHNKWHEMYDDVIPDNSIPPTEQLEALHTYMEDLTDNQKIWLIEYTYYCKGIKEIAERYNTTESAVKSWRQGALKKIRKKMGHS